ncbi:hypothetical protein JCM6882_004413 [Rhodosporidiobolus microsporus]
MSSTTPLNFAPYADPPDRSRLSLSSWSSPAPASDPPPAASSSYHSGAPVSSLSQGTSYSSSSSSAPYINAASGGYAPSGTGGGGLMSGYETTTLRHDWAGPICYAFGPLGAAFMLVFEVENDWVRFQAWQSVLLCAALALLHLFWAALFGGRFFQYLFVLLDVAALTLMSLRAYHDSDHLERHKLPLIGELADQFVRSE